MLFMKKQGIYVCALMLLLGCVSEEKYNDLEHANNQMQVQIERASGLNQQLQEYIDRHISEFHEGEQIQVPHFGTGMIPAFVKDSEMRDLRIEINRLKRESEYKNRVIRDLQAKCGPATTEPDTSITIKVEAPKD